MIRKIYAAEPRIAAIHQLRVNIKNLAIEAVFIRYETRRAGPAYRSLLTEHRRGKLREEARYAQLALAYLRGRAYRTVERTTRRPPCSDRLARKLDRFVRTVKPAELRAWLQA